MLSNDSALKLFASLPPDQQERLLRTEARKANLRPDELAALLIADWRFTGRPKQQEPTGDWSYWLILAGRGFGKTITGAQWAKKKGLEAPRRRIAMIAPTQADVRDTMVEGETGLLNVLTRDDLLGGNRDAAWNRTTLELRLTNGTIYKGFSSEKPDRLRGPQHHHKWCEEVSSWADASKGDKLNTTWSNANLGCRLGEQPQTCITTTPKPNRLTMDILKISGLALVTGSSYENRDNLSEAWWREVVEPLEGTRTARQEIHAEVLDEVEGALWTRRQLDVLRVNTYPTLKRVIVAVDPQGSSEEAANEAGIIVVGVGHDKIGYVIADRTPRERGPWAWGAAAVQAYHEFDADRVVAETNFGADMVEYVIKSQDPSVAFKKLTASRGKRVRAEPVADLYVGAEGWETDPTVRQPRVRHVGAFDELETEMVTWTPDADSPNRMDALVWGLTELKIWTPPGRTMVSVPRSRIPGIAPDGTMSATTDPYGRRPYV